MWALSEKISFFLSKYIYSSLCSTNGVSQQVPSRERSRTGALSKEKTGDPCFGVPRAPFSAAPLGPQPLGRGVQGKLEVFGEVRMEACTAPHACAEGRWGPARAVKQTAVAAVSRPGGARLFRSPWPWDHTGALCGGAAPRSAGPLPSTEALGRRSRGWGVGHCRAGKAG